VSGLRVLNLVHVRRGRRAGGGARGSALCLVRGGAHGDEVDGWVPGPRVRKTPSWPRSWANSSPFSLYSHRNARANSHLLGQLDIRFSLRRARHCAAKCGAVDVRVLLPKVHTSTKIIKDVKAEWRAYYGRSNHFSNSAEDHHRHLTRLLEVLSLSLKL
jgi:hypothetical protein